jgi:hypothetical protein
MNRTLIFLTTVAAALAACDNSTIVAGEPYDPQANTVANAGPVELPPAIASSKIYRCKDNSIVYIDWLSDNKSANVRTDRNAPPTQVAAPEAGQPMIAQGGYSLAGTATDASVMLALPGKGSQSCKA